MKNKFLARRFKVGIKKESRVKKALGQKSSKGSISILRVEVALLAKTQVMETVVCIGVHVAFPWPRVGME